MLSWTALERDPATMRNSKSTAFVGRLFCRKASKENAYVAQHGDRALRKKIFASLGPSQTCGLHYRAAGEFQFSPSTVQGRIVAGTQASTEALSYYFLDVDFIAVMRRST